MPENFPGIEQDCQDVIRRCNAQILAARACKAQVAMGSREGIRTQVQAMDKQAEELAELCQTLNDTTDHLVNAEPADPGRVSCG